jgi:TIR domain-containing protein
LELFISWSGENTASHTIAKAVGEWIQSIFQAQVKTFVSSHNIESGQRWFQEIGSRLESAHFGIVCVTPSNINAPWLLFEAGAIAKQVEQANVVPLLIGLAPNDLTGPLAQFHAEKLDQSGIRKIVSAINNKLGDNRLSDTLFEKTLEKWWPDLEQHIFLAHKLLGEDAKGANQPPLRETRDMVEEVLMLTREIARGQNSHHVTIPGVGSVTYDPFKSALATAGQSRGMSLAELTSLGTTLDSSPESDET